MRANPRWHRGIALLVEADPDERDRLAGALEGADFQVVLCPGPGTPDYTCVGGREGDCPLIHMVDLIVFDTALPGEALMRGTPAADLLALYIASGRPVVVLGTSSDRFDAYADERVLYLPRRPTGRSLGRAAMRLLDRASTRR